MNNAAAKYIKIIPLFVAALLYVTANSLAQEKPQAVSLDYCADQFILSLADPAQIMALTTDATEAHSYYRKKAKGLPQFHTTSEEVLHMKPDIVIRSWGGSRMLPLLAGANIPVATTEYGSNPEILYDNMRLIGTALGQSERADRMIKDHQSRMTDLHDNQENFSVSGHKPRAAYIAPGGITAGKDTFIDNIIRLAGLQPISEELGLVGWQPLPLEALVNNPPDIIIGSFFDMDNVHISNWSLTRHSHIKKMIDAIPTIMVPGRYLSCNGFFSMDAAEYIHAEAKRIFQ